MHCRERSCKACLPLTVTPSRPARLRRPLNWPGAAAGRTASCSLILQIVPFPDAGAPCPEIPLVAALCRYRPGYQPVSTQAHASREATPLRPNTFLLSPQCSQRPGISLTALPLTVRIHAAFSLRSP
jgi:hypothetical protein